MAETYIDFVDSNDNLDNSDKLRSEFDERGYLFFKDILNKEKILEVKKDFLREMRALGLLEKGDELEEEWNGGPYPTGDEELALTKKLSHLDSFNQTPHLPELKEIAQQLLGGKELYVWPHAYPRVQYPNADVVKSAFPGAFPELSHQDAHPRIGFGYHDYLVFWVPFTSLDEVTGGLAILPGSHKLGLLDYKVIDDMEIRGIPLIDRNQDTVWARTSYEPGDVLIFHNLTVHKPTVNRSNRLRLSGDYRYQLQSTEHKQFPNYPKLWFHHTLWDEVLEWVMKVQGIAASRAVYTNTGAKGDILDIVWTRLINERSTSTERAIEIAKTAMTERELIEFPARNWKKLKENEN